ncbi:hypothetical protein GCM10010319_33400 [Streptomyces blastmyceticus]|uniref:Uncharacterized protein n=1 Tax=Streptomyces blastmyceticus TaxID=68180 RepID=A0ABN0X2P0_9ACTN
MAGGGADRDGGAQGVAGDRKGLQAFGHRGGHELVGQLVQDEGRGRTGGVAGAGEVDADSGATGGQPGQADLERLAEIAMAAWPT